LLDDQLDGVLLGQFLLVGLAGGFDDSDAVRASVADHTGCEPDACVAGQRQEQVRLLRDGFLQLVLGGEPRLVAYEVCGDGGQSALPHNENAIGAYFGG